jgi:hypothetical protein
LDFGGTVHSSSTVPSTPLMLKGFGSFVMGFGKNCCWCPCPSGWLSLWFQPEPRKDGAFCQV